MRDRILKKLFLRYRRRGDGRALAALFDRTARELSLVAAHLAPGAGEAEDLVQLTFLRAMERAQHFDETQELLPWLHGILWREAAAARRRRARRAGLEDVHEPEGGVDPAAEVAGRELPETVRVALEELPPVYRAVVEPFLLAERAPHEIAAELGRAPGTVRVQLQRGLERLRRKLPREYAGLGLIGATRGLDRVREALLGELGVTAGAGPIASGALFAWTAFSATPLLWSVPLVAGTGALVIAFPTLLPLSSSASQANGAAPLVALAPTEDPMKTSSLLALPLAVVAASPSQEQREPVAVESTIEPTAEKAARLDALVGELVVLSQGEGTEASAAWGALVRASQRIAEEERRRMRARQPARADHARVTAWTEAVSQLEDPARRAQALREVEVALASNTIELQLAACQTLTACGQIEFDKAPFRPLLLPLAKGSTGSLRVSALYALFPTRQPEDAALALALADDSSPEVVESGPHLVLMYHDRNLTGAAGAAVVRMFSAATERARRSMLSGIWGAHVSPELEALVLDYSRSTEGESAYDAMYYALSTFDPKSEAVVRRLIEYLPNPDSEYHGRAMWGLGHGVAAEQGPLVAEAARKLFEARSDVSLQVDSLELVGQYGRSDLESYLLGIAEDGRRPASVREAASRAAQSVRER